MGFIRTTYNKLKFELQSAAVLMEYRLKALFLIYFVHQQKLSFTMNCNEIELDILLLDLDEN